MLFRIQRGVKAGKPWTLPTGPVLGSSRTNSRVEFISKAQRKKKELSSEIWGDESTNKFWFAFMEYNSGDLG